MSHAKRDIDIHSGSLLTKVNGYVSFYTANAATTRNKRSGFEYVGMAHSLKLQLPPLDPVGYNVKLSENGHLTVKNIQESYHA
jgi:hypothetical protein